MKNMQIMQNIKFMGRYVFVTLREFYSQHNLWFYVQVYAAVMQWTCSACWLHTGSSCFCQEMHYKQFHMLELEQGIEYAEYTEYTEYDAYDEHDEYAWYDKYVK